MTMHDYKILSTLSGDGIYLAEKNNKKVVLKKHPHFATEAKMLGYLAPYLNVPKVLETGTDFFAMEYIESDGMVDDAQAARALASLHTHTHATFGFEYDTTIGPHLQPNPVSTSWIDFYREERIRHMAKACMEAGRFGTGTMVAIELLCDKLELLLYEPVPALLHGDVWGGNVMSHKGEVVFIDPAVYYGHNEVELAFIAMFNTFGKRFYDVYDEMMPIEKGFFEERLHLYQLYPVLVHVRSFGSGYMGMLEKILKRFP